MLIQLKFIRIFLSMQSYIKLELTSDESYGVVYIIIDFQKNIVDLLLGLDEYLQRRIFSSNVICAILVVTGDHGHCAIDICSHYLDLCTPRLECFFFFANELKQGALLVMQFGGYEACGIATGIKRITKPSVNQASYIVYIHSVCVYNQTSSEYKYTYTNRCI